MSMGKRILDVAMLAVTAIVEGVRLARAKRDHRKIEEILQRSRTQEILDRLERDAVYRDEPAERPSPGKRDE